MKVRLYSYVTFATGYGRAGRELAHSLLAVGVDLEVHPLGIPSSQMAVGEDVLRGLLRLNRLDEQPDAVIVHALPFECPKVLEHLKLVKGQGPLLIAYSTWEGQTRPTSLEQTFAAFDQVWMPNEARWKTIGDVPLFAVPHSYDAGAIVGDADIPERTRGEHEPFRFYTIGAWQARKNMGGLIRAFAHTFTPADHVELIIHSSGADAMSFAAAKATTGLSDKDLPSIKLSNEQVTDDAIERLHANGDCFVTASRGEAWHFPAFDAMLSGRHVISPKNLGSDDYLGHQSPNLLQGTSALLYGACLAPPMADVAARQDSAKGVALTVTFQHGLDARQFWLEPDLAQLGIHMRNSFNMNLRTIDIRYDVLARFGRAAVGKLALAALEAS